MGKVNAMKYKKSEFNYVHEKEDYVLIYNTLYNSLIRLDLNEYEQYLDEKEISEILLENGFFVEKELNEKAKYLTASQVFGFFI